MTALADLRALLAVATPPPWTVDHDVRPTELSYVRVNGHLRAELDGRRLLNERADAELIVAAVNSLPHLVAVAEAAEDKEIYLVARLNDLAHALEKAITTLEYVGGCDLIVEELRRVFYAEAGVAASRSHDAGRAALSVLDEQEPK